MAFTDIERACHLTSLEWLMEKRRPPEHIRPQIDMGYAIAGQAVDIFQIVPDWQDKTLTQKIPFARIKYVKTQNEWRLYWMRRDLKWHLYEPAGIHKSLKAALDVVHADACGCFFG